MCGICGVFDRRGAVNESLIASMRDALVHRGPDDAGLYINETRTLGLGHRRLSIIDLSSRGKQPLSNEDGSIRIVFNGEIYNFQELRSRLIEKGHRFFSRTDSEVIVHLYEEEELLSFLKKLRGMFAFALFDQKRKKLLLARDRAGQKPIYYCLSGQRLAFASEIKAFFYLPWISKEIDLNALDLYFTFGYVPWDRTIFREIRKLPPAHYFLYDISTGRGELDRYWELPQEDGLASDRSENELTDELEEILLESVRLRMISDVPLGVFLSGGVDSSTVATIMANLSSKSVKTFSIGFSETRYNELDYARKVSRHINSDHHEFIVRPWNLVDIVSQIPLFFDEPFADSSAIPTFIVSKLTRDHVKVALAGDGGDELFAGYNWYTWVQTGVKLAKYMGPLRKPVGLAGRYLPSWVKGKHFLERLSLDAGGQFLRRVGIFQSHEKRHLFNPEVLNQVEGEHPLQRGIAALGNPSTDLISQMSRFDFNYYLPDDILVKVDRTSMAISLEVRAPFLDHYLCEFAFRLPTRFKYRRGIRKYLLKQVAKKLLPPELPLERKQGFSIPISDWMMKDPLCSLFFQTIAHPGVRDYLNVEYLLKLMKQHKRGLANNGVKLFSILVFLLWMEKYL